MLSNTAYVILGFLSRQPSSGYDIKQKVDISTRFFFASSYGQIYPELRKLEDQGLIKGAAKSQGQRARTEYTLTASGRKELDAWLASPGDGVEMRDEGMLKLFFSIHLDREDQIARIKSLRAERVEGLAQLQDVKRVTAGTIPEMPEVVLGYGLELYEFIVGWCDRMIEQLETTPPKPDPITASLAGSPKE